MERLDPRALKRISGPSWEPLRSRIAAIHAALVHVSPVAYGQLTTIYVKYTTPEIAPRPFAVVWIKRASEITVGLAVPPDNVPSALSGPPAGCKYSGLTGYLTVTASDAVPNDFAKWAANAYEHAQASGNG